MLDCLGRNTAARRMAGESSAPFAKQMSYNLPIPSLAEPHAVGRSGYE